jgi:hypothetical protein
MTTSVSFCHFCLDCTLILQFLHPNHVTSSSNSLHHLNCVLPLLSPFPPSLVQKNFFAGSLSSVLSTRNSTKLNTFHIIFIKKLTYFILCSTPNIQFQVPGQYFPQNLNVRVSKKILVFFTHS